jgi:hypothetical protein
MNIALADATIAVWNAKNTYNFWRPITAIRATTYPTRTPLLTTPAFQEYPSAHSGVSSAATTVLAAFYDDNMQFTVTSAGFGNATRTFTSSSAAVQEVQDARHLRRLPLPVLNHRRSHPRQPGRQLHHHKPDAPPRQSH